MNDFDYYTITRKGDGAYPMVKVVGREFTPDNYESLLYLEFNTPVPRNPVMADYLAGPGDFVTKRIANVIESLNIEGISLIPTKLTDKKGNTIDDYVSISVNEYYKALDKEKSDFTVDEDDEDMYSITRIILDKDVLSKIPLKQRLAFCLEEEPGYQLYHESVVEEIMKLNPTGMYFENIEEINIL